MGTVIWTVFELIVNLFQAYISIDFARKIMIDNKTHKKLYFIFAVLGHFFILSIQNYYTFEDNWFTLIYILWGLIYTIVSLSGSLARRLIAVIMPSVLIMMITIGILDFFNTFLNISIKFINSNQSLIRVLLIILAQVLIYFSFNRFSVLFSEKSERFNLKEWIIAILIMLFSIIMGALLHNTLLLSDPKHISFLIGLSIMFLIMLVILMISMTIALIRKNRVLRETEALKMRQQYQQYYIDNASHQYESIKRLRHDIKDQLSAVGYLLKSREYNKAEEVINKYRAYVERSEPVVNTNNFMVNAIINSKLTAAMAMGVTVTCLSVKDFDGIEEHDLFSLLSNSIENAVTSCTENKQHDKQIISVNIRYEEGVYTFLIVNSISDSVLNKNPELKTNKSGKESHGYGTKILREIAEKYKGRCDFFEKDNMFYCKLSLPSNK